MCTNEISNGSRGVHASLAHCQSDIDKQKETKIITTKSLLIELLGICDMAVSYYALTLFYPWLALFFLFRPELSVSSSAILNVSSHCRHPAHS